MRKISLDRLPFLFPKYELGGGSFSLFNLEEGLQLRSWHCRLEDGLELNLRSHKPNGYCHLVFFLHTSGVRFVTDCNIQRNSIWDTVFFTSFSDHKIIIPPSSSIQCLSMSFSQRWLNKNLSGCNQEVSNVLKRLLKDSSICVLECMDMAEKKNVFELSEMILIKGVGSFYIKSTTLKIIGDFFLKLKHDKALFSF